MLKAAFGFITFSIKRFETADKVVFFSVAITAFFLLVSALILPILQRDIIEGVQVGDTQRTAIIMMIIISFIGIFCIIYETLVLNKLNLNLRNRLQREMIGSAIRNNSKIITSRGSGAFISSVFGDSEQISQLLSTNYFTVFLVFIQGVLIIFITLTWTWIFAAVVTPIYVFSIITIVISNKIHISQFTLGRESVMKLNPKVLENIENRLSILGFSNISVLEGVLFSELSERDFYFRNARVAGVLAKTITRSFETIGLVVLFLLSMSQINEGHLNIASFIAMLAYYASIFIPLSVTQSLTQGMGSFKMHYERIKDDLTKNPTICLPKTPDLKFENCTFTYNDSNGGQILDFSIRVDKKIGIVGLSGDGKTTIIKILLGTIMPQKGACLLGGVDVSDVSKSFLHSFVRLYGQDLELFNSSLEYNITLGKIPLQSIEYEEKLNEYKEKLNDLLTTSSKGRMSTSNKAIIKDLFILNDWQTIDYTIVNKTIDELKNKSAIINVLPEIIVNRKFYVTERYTSIVEDLNLIHLSGRELGQRGANVSGGEKNKICLARFLLPMNKGFYVMDEPLTSVDPISEEQCVSVIRKYLDCIGGIIISHKLNLIRDLSDEIVVLEKGVSCERGLHKDLINTQGLYSKLYNAFNNLRNV